MPLFGIEPIVLLDTGLRCAVVIVGRTLQIPMDLVDPGSIIDHKLMRSIRVLFNPGGRPVVRVSKMEMVGQFEIKE